MPIAHNKKLIFIHIPRTGGTSVEKNLSLIAKSNKEDLEVFYGKIFSPKIKAHNFSSDYLHHLRAAEIKEIVGEKIFNSYFKFAFVRNPWDKLVSLHTRLKEHKSPDLCKAFGIETLRNVSFERFIDLLKNRPQHHHLYPQYKFVTNEDKKTIVDFIGKFENLEKDFYKVCKKAKLRFKRLPKKNRTKHTHYSKYYTDTTKKIVAEIYADDIEMFQYEFNKKSFFYFVKNPLEIFSSSKNSYNRYKKAKV
jgi:chondroitin 4-sulfotransferase 11